MAKALTTHLDIVSAEASVFSGLVQRLSLTAALGEMGIYPGHAPILTTIRPGHVRLRLQDDEEQVYYISGGILEVVPNCVTILADVVQRASDLDEGRALEAKQVAEKAFTASPDALDHAKAMRELARASGRLRAIKEYKKIRKQG